MHSYDALSDLHVIAQREANGCVGLLLQVVQRGIWQSAQTHCFVLCSFRVAGVNSSSGLSSAHTLQVYIGRFTWLSSCGAHRKHTASRKLPLFFCFCNSAVGYIDGRCSRPHEEHFTSDCPRHATHCSFVVGTCLSAVASKLVFGSVCLHFAHLKVARSCCRAASQGLHTSRFRL